MTSIVIMSSRKLEYVLRIHDKPEPNSFIVYILQSINTTLQYITHSEGNHTHTQRVSTDWQETLRQQMMSITNLCASYPLHEFYKLHRTKSI